MFTKPRFSWDNIAKHFDIHSETVRRWVLSDRMSAISILKAWRFKVSQVDAWGRAGADLISSPANRTASTTVKEALMSRCVLAQRQTLTSPPWATFPNCQ